MHEHRLARICARYPAYPQQIASVVRNAKLIARRINDRANAVLQPWGLSHTEFNLLMMLYGAEDYALNPSLLGDAAVEKSANITRLTNHLCDKGLIQRNASKQDRRKISVSLTPQGLQLLEDALPAVSSDLEEHGQGLTQRELAQLDRLQKKYLVQLDVHPTASLPSA
ncbi:MarR family winged helix-turn-helix transcriptional regulator [Polaromonas sp. SM01]|uniref:MarR family winged helix-turn-helix transcriptional regulator n=1 Tax=Polaromonas sp. SM01 TaxID=3085630 RepID=UPI002981F156|nr:MarR family transcriptional regulator [Polaromonas sp. SM01]MDW5443121.1 MarR family transcriptional regulator [Polaromonas sp. SM01]